VSLRASIGRIRASFREWIQPLVLGLVVAAATWVGFAELQPEIHDFLTFNAWFQADVPAHFNQLTSFETREHTRTSRHPLFPMFSTVPVAAVRVLTGMAAKDLVALWLAACSAVWITLIWAALRTLGLTRGAATAFAALAATSAAAFFSLPVPGYYVLGSAALIGALLVVAASERGHRAPSWLLIAVSAATLAFSTTQWMAGLAMLAFLARPVRALGLALASLVLVFALFGVQGLIVEHTRFFLPPDPDGYLFGLAPLGVLGVFFASAIALPALPDGALSVPALHPGEGSWLAALALVVWAALLIAALACVGSWRGRPAARWILVVLAGQLALHLAFGDETFLYAIHWVPLLVAFAALGALGEMRRWVVAGAAILAALLAVHNGAELLGANARISEEWARNAAFRDAVHRWVGTEQLVVRGMSPRPGHADKPAHPDPRTKPPRGFLSFVRKGWGLSYGLWDPSELEVYRANGAAWFVTDYAPGLADDAAIEGLRACYALRELDSGFAIVELVEPSCEIEGAQPAR
jgi:hypothetical protein